MRLRIWGVRGSLPAPGPKTLKYGGNTSCVEIRAGDELLIVDAGTGVRELGNSLLAEYKGKPIKASIFLTHTHWDHIHGLPFFIPAYIPGNEFAIHGPVSMDEKLEDILGNQMKYSYFPIKLRNMQAKKTFHELQEGSYDIGEVKVKTKYLNHPVLTLGYRFEHNGKAICVITDTEPYYNLFGDETGQDGMPDEDEIKEILADMNSMLADFIREADIAIYDSQYTAEEYSTKVGWGHSTFDGVTEICKIAGVKKLLYFHHDPDRSDQALDDIVDEMRKALGDFPMEVDAAREGADLEI